MKKFEDRGLEMLSRAGGDPIGRFLIRLIGPGVRKELGKIGDTVNGVIGGVSDAFESVESGGKSKRRPKEVIVDAVIVEESPKKK